MDEMGEGGIEDGDDYLIDIGVLDGVKRMRHRDVGNSKKKNRFRRLVTGIFLQSVKPRR